MESKKKTNWDTIPNIGMTGKVHGGKGKGDPFSLFCSLTPGGVLQGSTTRAFQ